MPKKKMYPLCARIYAHIKGTLEKMCQSDLYGERGYHLTSKAMNTNYVVNLKISIKHPLSTEKWMKNSQYGFRT